MNVGKELLQASPWTVDLFLRAIEADLRQLDDPEHARSALSIVAIFADHLVHLRAAGRIPELRDYSSKIHDFLNQHPDLPRLRDLAVKEQIGVRLDVIFQDLYAAERVAAPAATKELLNVQRGGAVRRAILDVLLQANRPLTTQEIMSRVEALKTRQHAHQTLRMLQEAALVNSASIGATKVHRLTALGRQTADELTPLPRPAPAPVIRSKVERRLSLIERIVFARDPAATGVLPQSDLLPQAD